MGRRRPNSKGGGAPETTARGKTLLPAKWDAQVWSVMRILAPAIVVVGLLGIVVGLIAGQSLGIVAVDAMAAVVGGVLLLLLRWR